MIDKKGMKIKALLLCSIAIGILSASAVDLSKQFFDTLEIEDTSLVNAVDRINKIHLNQSNGQPEFLILLQDPVNMDDLVSLSLSDVNLKLLLDILLSGTNYHYITTGQYVIIQNSSSKAAKPSVTKEDDSRESVCLIEVLPSSDTELSTSSSGNSGTGFLCKINGVGFLVTNIHVIEKANSLSDITVMTRHNVEVELTGGFVAQDRDLCIFRHKANPSLKYLTISDSVASGQSNDPIHLIGYPLGGGVLRRADGSLDGIGAELIELNCSAFAGNSGGPVFNSATNQVIGVVTMLQIVADDPFTELARKKLTNPIKDDIRTYATRLDTVEGSGWEALEWHVWKKEKERIYYHMKSLLALASLVDSNYKPGTLMTEETHLINDPEIWRAYAKCAKDYASAVSKNDNNRRSESLTDFVKFIEVAYRPSTGSKWRDLSKAWRYEWFVSPKSGNIYTPGQVEQIKKLYRTYHNEWEKMSKRWIAN